MSVSLAVQNPDAAQRLTDNAPLPIEGDIVWFYPRPSEIRQGRRRVPALVLKSDQDNQRLDILVIYDADDFHSLKNIMQRVGEDQGWEPRPSNGGGVSVERFEKFMAEMGEVLFGENAKPDSGSMLDAMTDIYQRLEALEKASVRK